MRCFCGSEMEKLFIKNDEYRRCPCCGYLKKINILNPTLEKKRYDSHVCDAGYLDYMKRVYKLILPYLKDGLSIDYGCGKIHALADIMNENHKECRYYDLYYYNNPIVEKFDNIILIEVFEHINNPKEALIGLKELLKSQGNIIIMTQVIKEPLDNWWYLRDTTHVSFFNEGSMKILAESLGLSFEFNKESQIFKLSKIN